MEEDFFERDKGDEVDFDGDDIGEIGDFTGDWGSIKRMMIFGFYYYKRKIIYFCLIYYLYKYLKNKVLNNIYIRLRETIHKITLEI